VAILPIDLPPLSLHELVRTFDTVKKCRVSFSLVWWIKYRWHYFVLLGTKSCWDSIQVTKELCARHILRK